MNTQTNWQKVLGGIALSAALAGGSAATYAAGAMDFDKWDENNSGLIEIGEWDTGFENDELFSGWDTDGDKSLTKEEFNRGIFNSYDADNSGDLSENEYKTFQDDAGEGGWLDV